MMHQAIFDTSRIFSEKGIRKVVLSPGSRNAPLTISFARNKDIQVYNIIDERSAGFIALGMAQKSGEPVVLCCTSGTAMLNFAPAVAEAYYQEIPLIVLSADRPPEWQGQRDGQTIQQPGALHNFVKKTFELPAQLSGPEETWEYTRKLNEAINLANITPKGPVHINIPFREPFYPTRDQKLKFSDKVHLIEPLNAESQVDFKALIPLWKQYNKRMIICGQHHPDAALSKALKGLSKQAVVVSDVIANTGVHAVSHHDLFLAGNSEQLLESLRPELIVSYGKSVISKSLKLYLRKYPASEHWHFDEGMVHADPFKSMSRIIQSRPHGFFESLSDTEDSVDEFSRQLRDNFIQNWKVEEQKTNRSLNRILKNAEFSEFGAFSEVMHVLPGDIDLHLANSMPVRFANFIQGLAPKTAVFCNRGTSGIDGTNGTAVGNALVGGRTTVLLTGDLSFFYDRNAFFHHYDLNNLKIIVFNNGGGGIFRLINGPSQLPELEQHFETRHNHSAKFTAMEYGFDYFRVDDTNSLSKALSKTFSKDNAPKLIEIFTDPDINKQVYQEVKKGIAD